MFRLLARSHAADFRRLSKESLSKLKTRPFGCAPFSLGLGAEATTWKCRLGLSAAVLSSAVVTHWRCQATLCENLPEAPHHCSGEQEWLPGGAVCTEYFFDVPVDYLGAPQGPTLRVFVREVVLSKHSARAKDLPVLLYLQGGPGFPAGRPSSANGGWLGHALQSYRVLLLDQRGTGRSTPVTAQTLDGMSVDAQVAYLVNFRADSIVKDCEVVRKSLGIKHVTLLGQSFGGFCALTYLSLFPQSLIAVYFAGGLAPVLAEPAEVYRHTYRRVLDRNRRFYSRYPTDISKVREIVAFLESEGGVPLPGGGRLTARRFLSLGLLLGMGNGLESMHWLLENAFVEVAGKRELDYRFLVQVESTQSFDTNPIFWMLHESIYCGPATGPSNWAAHRVSQELPFRTEFDYRAALANSSETPIMFTGEMVYPWFAEDFATLGSLAQTAEVLAQKADWPALYNIKILQDTQVPVAAAVYYDDMYVERSLSEDVASLLGNKCKIWVTNEFQHSGLRDNGQRVLDTLMKMTRGEIGIPS